MIEQDTLKLDSLIAHEVSIDDVQEAYKQIQNKEVLGVVLKYKTSDTEYQCHTFYQHHLDDTKQKKQEIRFIPAVKDTIRVGVVGAGGFAKIKLMPIVSKIRNVKN